MLKGNFFKTIASAFVEVQTDAPQSVETNAKQNVPPTQVVTPMMSTPVVGQPIVNSDGTIQGQLDNKLFEQLCEVLEESNIPGPDYVELTKAAQNDAMKAAIPDENARLMAAYISMKATAPQLNRGIVLGSIDSYVGILEKERQNGLGELQAKWIENVENPEKEVVKAQEEGHYSKVKSLQWLLTHSFYAKAMAVKRVTSNQGKNTSGVDLELWKTPDSKLEAVKKLKRRGYKPQPLRRIYIPKKNGKMRPLSIPTMTDRAMQTLYKFALEPIAETYAVEV